MSISRGGHNWLTGAACRGLLADMPVVMSLPENYNACQHCFVCQISVRRERIFGITPRQRAKSLRLEIDVVAGNADVELRG